MYPVKKRIFAAIILILLIGVPFWDWRLGAVLWMCAWLIFIMQNLSYRRSWKTHEDDEPPEDQQD